MDQLKKFIFAKAPLCIHEAQGRFDHRFVTPTYGIEPGADDNAKIPQRSLSGHYLQMYDWDACFFVEAADRIGDPGLARDVVANFLDHMNGDGHMPRTISPGSVWDKGDVCKPFLAQAIANRLSDFQSDELTTILDRLKRHLDYIEKNRRDSSGLFHWRNVLESGVDNNLALLGPCHAAKDENTHVADFPDGKLLAVDFSSYMVATYGAIADIAKAAGDSDTCELFRSRAESLAELIEDTCWNDKFGMYCNADTGRSERLRVRAWTGLLPVLLGFAKKERAQQVIEKMILSEEHFLRPSGLSSIAASEKLYNNSIRGLYGRVMVSNWQGPMWVLPNVLAVRCLLRFGYKSQAEELSRRVVDTLSSALAESGTMFENYHAETGAGLWSPQFMSWNVLALELIELLE